MIVAAKEPEIKRIRGPNLSVLATNRPGVPMAEALMKADAANAVIASNKRLSTIVVGNRSYASIQAALACWAGTMTAYVRPDMTFGAEAERISSLGDGYFIVYTDPKTNARYLFPVSEERLDEKNALLAVNHPDFKLEKDGRDWVVTVTGATKMGLVRNFPAIPDCWYGVDPEYGIPTGTPTARTLLERYFMRIEKRVGLVLYECYGRESSLSKIPSETLGVIMEAV